MVLGSLYARVLINSVSDSAVAGMFALRLLAGALLLLAETVFPLLAAPSELTEIVVESVVPAQCYSVFRLSSLCDSGLDIVGCSGGATGLNCYRHCCRPLDTSARCPRREPGLQAQKCE